MEIVCLNAAGSVKESTALSAQACITVNGAVNIFVKIAEHLSDALTIIAETSVAVTAI